MKPIDTIVTAPEGDGDLRCLSRASCHANDVGTSAYADTCAHQADRRKEAALKGTREDARRFVGDVLARDGAADPSRVRITAHASDESCEEVAADKPESNGA
ncbi:hypothetical protein ACIQVK_34700 [Streptomyces sp. NPDC090493]|uniref:hypothetical protein n=1 Tax=Streptomyces sp. NPDC090493 TaxID=3365964 RepID=UPI0037FB23DC